MEYVKKTISSLLPIEEGDEAICRALWLAVILQAVLDAKGKFGNSVTKRQAQVWLEGREGLKSEFAAVCTLAGIDFKKARKRCAYLIQEDAVQVDFRMTKQDLEKNRTVANRRRYYRRAERSDASRRKQIIERRRSLLPRASNDNFMPPSNDNRSENKVYEFND